MPSVAVIGANSMVGSRFCDLGQNDFNLIKTDLNGEIPVDITSTESVQEFFENYNFEYLILFSAFTDVDAAQKQNGDMTGICWKINVEGAKNVAEFSLKFDKKLIFISTDFIFDGVSGPYTEDSIPGPDLEKVSWYGKTKIEAEKKVFKNKNNIVLRITYPYRAKYEPKADFARSILQKAKEGNLYPMFADQIMTPTFADDLAPAIKILIEKSKAGIFHIASPKTTTPFEFAKYLLSKFNINQEVKEGSLEEFLAKPNSTPRPQKGGLLCGKIQKLGFVPTSWQDGIDKIFAQLS